MREKKLTEDFLSLIWSEKIFIDIDGEEPNLIEAQEVTEKTEDPQPFAVDQKSKLPPWKRRNYLEQFKFSYWTAVKSILCMKDD